MLFNVILQASPLPRSAQAPCEPLLPRLDPPDSGKMCVVIDLDETLVHSSFKVSVVNIHLHVPHTDNSITH